MKKQANKRIIREFYLLSMKINYFHFYIDNSLSIQCMIKIHVTGLVMSCKMINVSARKLYLNIVIK